MFLLRCVACRRYRYVAFAAHTRLFVAFTFTRVSCVLPRVYVARYGYVYRLRLRVPVYQFYVPDSPRSPCTVYGSLPARLILLRYVLPAARSRDCRLLRTAPLPFITDLATWLRSAVTHFPAVRVLPVYIYLTTLRYVYTFALPPSRCRLLVAVRFVPLVGFYTRRICCRAAHRFIYTHATRCCRLRCVAGYAPLPRVCARGVALPPGARVVPRCPFPTRLPIRLLRWIGCPLRRCARFVCYVPPLRLRCRCCAVSHVAVYYLPRVAVVYARCLRSDRLFICGAGTLPR